MARADFSEVLKVDKEKLFEMITRYEEYPQFVEGCTSAQVERLSATTAKVTYHVSMIKDVVYTLEHTEDRDAGRMSWKLIEGDVMKKNNGFWQLKDAGDGRTEVRYEVEVDFSIPAPGFIVNKLVKASLPKMIRGFADRANRS